MTPLTHFNCSVKTFLDGCLQLYVTCFALSLPLLFTNHPIFWTSYQITVTKMTPALKKKKQLTLFLRKCCSSTSKLLLEVHFPARIQIFHHADRGGGGESPSLPSASVLAGPESDPGELSANQWRRRCRQRRRLHKPVNGEVQTDTNRRVCGQSPILICNSPHIVFLHQNGEKSSRFFRQMDDEVFGKFRGTFESAG